MDLKVQAEVWKYLEGSQPDFVAIAWPCGPWSIMQNAKKTATQKAALADQCCFGLRHPGNKMPLRKATWFAKSREDQQLSSAHLRQHTTSIS